MEAVIEHTLEPELTAAPRKLHLPLRAWLLLSIAALLLGIFVLGSGRAVWEGAKLSWLAFSGHTINGKIVLIVLDGAPLQGRPLQQTAIRYAGDIPGPNGFVHRTGWIVLSAPSALPSIEMMPSKSQATPVFYLNQPVPLRYASLLGMTLCQPWGSDPGIHILTLFLAGGLVMTVSLFLLRRLHRWATTRLHLLRWGTATVGTITHKRAESEDMVRYFLRYGYADSHAHTQDREEQVSADQWRAFQVGQSVTVLYDPEHPAQAGLHALIVQK